MDAFSSHALRPCRLVLTIALAVSSAAPAFALQPVGAVSRAAAPASTDQLIIKYRDVARPKMMLRAAAEAQSSVQLALASAQRHGLTMSLLHATAGNALVTKLDHKVPNAIAQQIAREIAQSDPMVEYAEPDAIKRPSVIPNDSRIRSQWAYFFSEPGGSNFITAWNSSTGAGMVVAVIDTGYRPHVDLNARLVPGYDFIANTTVSNDGDGRDSIALDPGDWNEAGECGAGSEASHSSWHGTHVAGTIAAVTNNRGGVAGGAYGAKVQPVRALGRCGGYDSDIADAVIWASGVSVPGLPANPTPARVINLALSGRGRCASYMQSAIDTARSRNSVLVVAAGNESLDASGFSPANCRGVITVAASRRNGQNSAYTNSGIAVALSAPGGDQQNAVTDGILSTANTGAQGPEADTYLYYEGTSMASAHVSAAVALMLAKNPSLTPDQVVSRLRVSANPIVQGGPCNAQICGAGILEAKRAVASAALAELSEITGDNDSIATAQSLNQGAVFVNGSISSGSDVDYYKIAVPAKASATISVAPAKNPNVFEPLTYGFSATLLDSAGNRLPGVVEQPYERTDRATYSNNGLTTQTVYFRVSSPVPVGYSLMLQF